MWKQYFKQAWNLMRQEKLFSAIYIIGTGLAVSMVMALSIALTVIYIAENSFSCRMRFHACLKYCFHIVLLV